MNWEEESSYSPSRQILSGRKKLKENRCVSVCVRTSSRGTVLVEHMFGVVHSNVVPAALLGEGMIGTKVTF